MLAFTARFSVSMQLYRPRSKTAHRALHGLFLRLHPFKRPRYQTGKSGYNTACTTLEGIHAPGRAQPIPDTTATPGRCTGQHIPSIIIRYIRGAGVRPAVDPCQTVQHIADHASPAGHLLPCADHWQVLTRCQQYKPGAPAEGSAAPPVNLAKVSPAACALAPGQRSRRAICHPPPGGAVQRRVARNYWRLSPHLFSGFRPIANKGQQ